MDKRIQEILQELYAVDPGLRQHEASLKKIISGLLLSQPKILIDAEFIGGLRRKLQASAETLKKQPRNLIFNFKFMKKRQSVLGGIAVVALIAVGSLYVLQNRGNLASRQNQPFSSDVQIAALGKGAFGNLLSRDFSAKGPGGGSGGGSAETANTALSAPSSAPAGIGGGSAIMPPYQQFKYVYKGEQFSVDQSEMPVFRRIKGWDSAAEAAQVLENLNFGAFNLHSFNNLVLQTLNFIEDRDFGYAFYINLQEGTLSISENWLRWGEGGRLCQGMMCAQPANLGVSDIPDDQTLIKLAGDFLSEHNISTQNYGTPAVQNYWRAEYEKQADKSQFYFPEIVSVIYPLKLSGQEVCDESGNPTGLSVNINVRYKKVSGLSELSSQKYESSLYGTETDTARLIKLAEQGNFRNYGGYGVGYPALEESVQMVEVELQTPEKVLMKMWSYENGESEELIVPALAFPIANPSSGQYFYQTRVVIPLIKDILDKQADGSVPVPMMKTR